MLGICRYIFSFNSLFVPHFLSKKLSKNLKHDYPGQAIPKSFRRDRYSILLDLYASVEFFFIYLAPNSVIRSRAN